MERRLAVVARFVVIACLAGHAAASDLFGVSLPPNNPSLLYSVNQSSGQVTTIGTTGFSDVTDLTSNPLTGTIWGVDVTTRQLLVINPHTGAASAVATLDSAEAIASIAFDPVTGGLFGNTAVEFGPSSDTLYRIDPITGHTTAIGSIGKASVFALAFDQHGVLLGVSNGTHELITISTATGMATQAVPIDALKAFDIASRPEDNTMFLADSNSGQLYTLNTATGATLAVGPYGTAPTPNIAGLAFMSEAPEASTYVTVMVGLGLVFVLRRRRSH
jgi:hypothetical protein